MGKAVRHGEAGTKRTERDNKEKRYDIMFETHHHSVTNDKKYKKLITSRSGATRCELRRCCRGRQSKLMNERTTIVSKVEVTDWKGDLRRRRPDAGHHGAPRVDAGRAVVAQERVYEGGWKRDEKQVRRLSIYLVKRELRKRLRY